MINRNFALAATVLLALSAGGCKSPEAQLQGQWKFSDVKLPANSPNQAQVAQAKQQMSSATADFKADKSFSLGIPQAPIEGTWTINGHTVSMTVTKAGGQDIAQLKKQFEAFAKGNPQFAKQMAAMDKPITATLSDDGKTLTLDATEGKQGQLVFAKGA